ncbi:ribosomal protein L21-like protein [Trametes punicea]|nr:ribosomal protein L21-like protein [Trametes punicea]
MASLLRPSLRAVTTRALHTQTVAPTNTPNALSLIRSQPSHYVVASVAGRKYLLTSRDLLTVPRLKDVKVGDVLRLSDIHELGSREYTIRGNPAIPPEQVRVEATVVEHTKGKMEFIFKKKRRKGYERTVQHKQTYTRLRIGPIEIVEDASTSS